MDRKFRHRTQIRVRNYEVDWQGIVHNANYLLYFEIGRIEYLKCIGIALDLTAMNSAHRVVLARNEVDYISSARFDELLNIYTRIASINETSFVFEGRIEESSTRRLVCENIAVHVWISPRTGEPMRVGDGFRKTVSSFERGALKVRPPRKRREK